ncbi:MAG: hypothetical protein LBU37_16105, partial [Tannerellaceae bacterium]|nr:hypothetical protein [Tannerellaceae bacterium]
EVSEEENKRLFYEGLPKNKKGEIDDAAMTDAQKLQHLEYKRGKDFTINAARKGAQDIGKEIEKLQKRFENESDLMKLDKIQDEIDILSERARAYDDYIADAQKGKLQDVNAQPTEEGKETSPDLQQTGRDVLAELNRISADIHLSAGNAVIDGTWDGDFRGAGQSTLEIDNEGNVVLRRGATTMQHLTKDGQSISGRQELYDTSLTDGGGNGIPTSSNSQIGDEYRWHNDGVMGVFRIPINDFLELARNGEIILGNIEEYEVVISPSVAQKYLSETTNNLPEIQAGNEGLPAEIQIDLSENEGNMQELDDKGIPFVKASDGTTVFGEVNDEQAKAIGTNVAAPIKLSEGNEDYGRIHIAEREGQLQQNGYNSVEEFVEDVSKNYDEIREGNLYTDIQGNEKETFLLVKKGEKGNVLYIELSPDKGSYSVNSGGVFKNTYINKRGLLWNASTEHSTPSAITQDFPTTQLNAESGAVSALSQSNPLSTGEDNANNPNDNSRASEKEEKQANERPANVIDLINNTAKQQDIKDAEAKVNTNPSEAQKKAGNYKMGHVNIQGLDISIENPKGSTRSGVDRNGKKWSVKMKNTYGYIRGTESKDGDHIDVFVGNNPNSSKVFVVDQINPETGEFDEHKVMLGFDDIEQARKSYLSNYSKGWQGLGDITETEIGDFREWAQKEGARRETFNKHRESVPKIAATGFDANSFLPSIDYVENRMKQYAEENNINLDDFEGTPEWESLYKKYMNEYPGYLKDFAKSYEDASDAKKREMDAMLEGVGVSIDDVRDFLDRKGKKGKNDIRFRDNASEDLDNNEQGTENLSSLEGLEIIETPRHDFKNIGEARTWAKENITGTYHNANADEDISVSRTAIDKYLSEKAIKKSTSIDVHLSAIKQLPKLIETSVLVERHPDRDSDIHIKEIQRLYGAINYKGENYPVKITVKATLNDGNKAYSYEVMSVETPPKRTRDDINTSSRGHIIQPAPESSLQLSNNPDISTTDNNLHTSNTSLSVAENRA